MISKAPRVPSRLRQGWARGALLAVCFWPFGASSALSDTIVAARYTEPTTRYPHGVLGDQIEYGALELTVERASAAQTEASTKHRSVLTIRLPEDRVFEDLVPRLSDVDQDGTPEVLVVESQKDKGAQLAIYDAGGEKIAATPHIGTRFRWLAPVGVWDMDQDGHVEIAYIDRPHLAKTLRIWRFEDGALSEIASLPGLTNHRIGEAFITGGLRYCTSGPEFVLVSADWREIIGVSYDQGWQRKHIAAFTPDAVLSALSCQ